MKIGQKAIYALFARKPSIKENISGKRRRTGVEKQDGERACKVQDVFTGGCSTVCGRLVAEGHP